MNNNNEIAMYEKRLLDIEATLHVIVSALDDVVSVTARHPDGKTQKMNLARAVEFAKEEVRGKGPYPR